MTAASAGRTWPAPEHSRLLAFGAAVALLGAARLRARRVETTRRLFELELDGEMAEVRRQLEATRLQRHQHDLVNALTAVEGAATILARDTVSAQDRSILADVLGSSVGRLRSLLFAGPEPEHASLAELTASMSEEPNWSGDVDVEVGPDLMVAASSSEIAETIRQLLINATRRAPSTPVTIRAHRIGDSIELCVDDEGPRLSAAERLEVCEPDRRHTRGPGPVGPIHIAMRLARGQGGQLTVEGRPGGGESFRVSWPASLG